MKKGIVLLLIFLFSLSISGCSPKIYSDDFIIDSEKVRTVFITVEDYDEDIFGMEGEYYDIENEEQVKTVLNILKCIEVKELSSKRVHEIFKSKEIFSQKVNYRIYLWARDESNGLIYVLEEEKLMFAEPTESLTFYL